MNCDEATVSQRSDALWTATVCGRTETGFDRERLAWKWVNDCRQYFAPTQATAAAQRSARDDAVALVRELARRGNVEIPVPDGDCGYCAWCQEMAWEDHKPDCLWLRAAALVKRLGEDV